MMILSAKQSTFARTRSRKTLVSRVFLFLSLWRERNALKDLDQHLLDDIGVSAAEARAEADRPVWDAPHRWMQ